MRVIIAGSRNFKPTTFDEFWLIEKLVELKATEVVSGCATGADSFGEQIGTLQGLPIKRFPADWEQYGKAAGPIRNQQMAEYADALIVFPDGGKGTIDMEMRALQQELDVLYRT